MGWRGSVVGILEVEWDGSSDDSLDGVGTEIGKWGDVWKDNAIWEEIGVWRWRNGDVGVYKSLRRARMIDWVGGSNGRQRGRRMETRRDNKAERREKGCLLDIDGVGKVQMQNESSWLAELSQSRFSSIKEKKSHTNWTFHPLFFLLVFPDEIYLFHSQPFATHRWLSESWPLKSLFGFNCPDLINFLLHHRPYGLTDHSPHQCYHLLHNIPHFLTIPAISSLCSSYLLPTALAKLFNNIPHIPPHSTPNQAQNSPTSHQTSPQPT